MQTTVFSGDLAGNSGRLAAVLRIIKTATTMDFYLACGIQTSTSLNEKVQLRRSDKNKCAFTCGGPKNRKSTWH